MLFSSASSLVGRGKMQSSAKACKVCGHVLQIIVLSEVRVLVDLTAFRDDFGAEVYDLNDAAGEAECCEWIQEVPTQG